MNPLFARSVHPKMSTNILDHVRTLAVLLKAKFSNGGSRRTATAPTRATGGVFFFFPRSATIAVFSKERDQATGLFLQLERNPELQDPFRKRFQSEQVSFSSKLK